MSTQTYNENKLEYSVLKQKKKKKKKKKKISYSFACFLAVFYIIAISS